MRLNKRKARGMLVRSGLYRPVMFLRRHLLRRYEIAYVHESVQFFKNYIKPGQLVFDVGGNIGNAAEIFLRCGATVISLEPLPHCTAELVARFGFDPRFRCVPKAVGASLGSSRLYIHRNDFMSSFNKEWSSDWHTSVEVPVTTLDSLIEEFGDPAFLKIDVEGWEKQVLTGLTKPVPMLSFEYHSGEGGYATVVECLDRLETLGTLELNRTPQEKWALACNGWMSRDDLLCDLKSHMISSPNSYGDILVRILPTSKRK